METLQPDFQDLVLGVAACSRPAPRPWQGLLLVTALATALVTALGEKKQVTARNILRLGGSTSTASTRRTCHFPLRLRRNTRWEQFVIFAVQIILASDSHYQDQAVNI